MPTVEAYSSLDREMISVMNAYSPSPAYEYSSIDARLIAVSGGQEEWTRPNDSEFETGFLDPLQAKDPLAVFKNEETFVFVFIFYEVVGLQLAWYDIFKWLVVLSEYCFGQYRHRHVGISIGRRLKNRITLLPYDLSCWNGRVSSPTILRHQNDDSPTKNIVRACDAVYMHVPINAVSDLLDNFNERRAALC